jgi:hypothetical protein
MGWGVVCLRADDKCMVGLASVTSPASGLSVCKLNCFLRRGRKAGDGLQQAESPLLSASLPLLSTLRGKECSGLREEAEIG